MSIYIRDRATDLAVRRLAKLKGKTLTETIREAVEAELQSERGAQFNQRLKAIQDKFAQYPKSGLAADKAFFDELSGDI